MPDDGHTVTALLRGLEILRCFDRPRLQLTVSEIARRVGLSQPTAWRLCRTLMDGGFLTRRTGSSALSIGAPALTLGFAAVKGLSLPALASPYMQMLTDRFGCSTTLSLRQGTEIMSIDSCHGNFLEPNRPVGWRAALGSTASGLAVLAVLPPADRAETLGKLQARDAAAWPRRAARIEAADSQYHKDGVVTFEGMFDASYTTEAVPLVEDSGSEPIYWAISCGGLTSRWNDEILVASRAELLKIKSILQPAIK